MAESRIRQLPWRQVDNPHGTLPILDPEGVSSIHDASIRVLEELGIELWSEPARKLFADAGATVDGETVRVGRDIITAALSTAPSSFTLTSRNPDRALDLGGNRMAFGLVAGPPAVHDEINGRRTSNMGDYENFIRLAHYFNAIHIIGNQVSAPPGVAGKHPPFGLLQQKPVAVGSQLSLHRNRPRTNA